MPAPIVLAFDIGIRNLAWCLYRGDTADLSGSILGWQNYDLLTGQGAEVVKKKVTCHLCTVGAAFTNPETGLTCLRHCPPHYPPLKDLSGVVLKRLPPLETIRALMPTVRGTKAKLVTTLALTKSLPLEKVKVKKAIETELTSLHDAIRTFIAANLDSFRQATHILLENQPVLKNPTMKSVQIILFATLRDMIQPPPPLKLVHAGKKIQGKEVGDKGYKSRKDASEAATEERLTKMLDGQKWLTYFKGHAKKSDLADAFCMCYDAAATAATASTA
jgi:hypothetical protein